MTETVRNRLGIAVSSDGVRDCWCMARVVSVSSFVVRISSVCSAGAELFFASLTKQRDARLLM